MTDIGDVPYGERWRYKPQDEATGLVFSEIASKVANPNWWKFARLILGRTEEQIEEFKHGGVPEEYMFLVIRKKCEQEPMWLKSHLHMLPPEKRATYLDHNRADEKYRAMLIYDIIESIPLKERRRFCEDEVGINPPETVCEVSHRLKMEMLNMYWEEEGTVGGGINGGKPQTLEKLLEQVGEFFNENKEGSKKEKLTTIVNSTIGNLFVDCKMKIYFAPNTEFSM